MGKNSAKAIELLSRSLDNVNFSAYETVQDLVKEAVLRHIDFKRIVISTVIISKVNPEADFVALNDFIKNNSPDTEVVLIVPVTVEGIGDTHLVPLFERYFNSVLYTSVMLSKASPKSLRDIVVLDIIKLSAEYGNTTETKPVSLLNNSSLVNVEPENKKVEEPKPKKKQGLFGKLFGGSGNSNAEKSNSVREAEEDLSSTTNMGDITSNMNPDSVPQNITNVIPNVPVKPTVSEPISNNSEIVSEQVSEGTPLVGNEDFSDEDSLDDLSLGELGGQHSDTGYLDEESNAELEAFLASKNSKEVVKAESYEQETIYSEVPTSVEEYSPITEEEQIVDNTYSEESYTEEEAIKSDELVSNISQYSSIEDDEDYGEVLLSDSTDIEDLMNLHKEVSIEDTVKVVPQSNPQPNSFVDKFSRSIKLILGARVSNFVQTVVDEVAEHALNDLNVLVVDLDFRENELLSFIDTNLFYANGSEFSLRTMKAYVEDSVSILSNGYGNRVHSVDLEGLLSSDYLMNFNKVYVICPTDCMSALSVSALRFFTDIFVYCQSERNALLSTTLGLTNRDEVSLEVEKFVMDACTYKVLGTFVKEEINEVAEDCLFANGSWLNRVVS